jgi:hypothetical protein
VPDGGGAGDALPVATFDGVPFFGPFLTSSLHLDTSSVASLCTAGSLCVRRRLIVTPIRVCRKRSSVAWTPVLRSPRSLSREELGSLSCMALVIALPRSSISLASMAMVKVGMMGEGAWSCGMIVCMVYGAYGMVCDSGGLGRAVDVSGDGVYGRLRSSR